MAPLKTEGAVPYSPFFVLDNLQKSFLSVCSVEIEGLSSRTHFSSNQDKSFYPERMNPLIKEKSNHSSFLKTVIRNISLLWMKLRSRMMKKSRLSVFLIGPRTRTFNRFIPMEPALMFSVKNHKKTNTQGNLKYLLKGCA